MDRELEIAGAASLGGWLRWKKHHTLPVGTPCPNCATPLNGPYCHECGQLGEQFNRSLLPLIWEAFESFFHADGRLLHTMPLLVWKPARLTRDYIEGRRAAQVPPLRMFLVVMLIFFFVGTLDGKSNVIHINTPESASADPAVSQQVKDTLAKYKTNEKDSAAAQWFKPRLLYATTHPREYTMVFEEWTHRIAILMLPVAAAILSLVFILRRRFYVFDHLIFAMHSLSFMGLLASIATLFALLPVIGGLGLLLALVAPVHLFVHMRGVYGTGIFGTLWRMLALFLLSAIALGMMMLGVLVIGLTEMEGAPEAKAPAPVHGAPAPAKPNPTNIKVD